MSSYRLTFDILLATLYPLGKGGRCVGLTTSGPVQACTGIAVPLQAYIMKYDDTKAVQLQTDYNYAANLTF